jgi:hypothetical protein
MLLVGLEVLQIGGPGGADCEANDSNEEQLHDDVVKVKN